MFISSINYAAVFVSALVSMGLGFLWYSPVLFGKPWMKLMKYTEKSMKAAQQKMGPMYGLSFVASLVTAYILSFFINATAVASLLDGFQLAFMAWLGFEATVMLTDVIFGSKKWALFTINAGYQLVSLLIMAGILTYWV